MKSFQKWRSQCLSNKIFDIVNYTVMILMALICLYPLYYLVIASVSDRVTGLYLVPINFNVTAYTMVLKEKDVWIGYANTIYYTVGAIFFGLLTVLPPAYSLSRKDFIGKGLVTKFMVGTMFISGGLVPGYLNMYNLGLLNSRWAIIVCGLMSSYHIIITRTFFKTNIPDELFEAAKMDGCGNGTFFVKVVLPLSKPIIAVLSLYLGVAQWNSYFSEMIYLRDSNKYPLSLVLRRYLSNIKEMERLIDMGMIEDVDNVFASMQMATVMQYALIIISTIPMLVVYPFIQKHFSKGIMIGSLKG